MCVVLGVLMRACGEGSSDWTESKNGKEDDAVCRQLVMTVAVTGNREIGQSLKAEVGLRDGFKIR